MLRMLDFFAVLTNYKQLIDRNRRYSYEDEIHLLINDP